MKKDDLSIKTICEAFFDLEKQHDLFSFKIRDVKIWSAVRMDLYYEVAQRTGVLDQPHTEKKLWRERLKNAGSFIVSTTLFNLLLSWKRRDAVIFDHSRKVIVGGRYIDIYTEYLIEDLRREKINFEVIEGPYLNRHFSARESVRKNVDFVYIVSNVIAKLFRLKLNEFEMKQVLELDSLLKGVFPIAFNLPMYLRYELTKFKVRYALFKLYLKIKRPKKLYMVVAYGHPYLVKAAKDLGIEVLELQHGVFSTYHLGYSYPDVAPGSIEYFPNTLLIWDDFWRSMAPIPLPRERIIVRPFEHLLRESAQFRGIKKNRKKILVISQGTIGARLAEVLRGNIADLSDYDIYYKLHPGEFDRWRAYEALVEMSALANVTIFADNSIPLYRLMAESYFVLGVYSTAIFEALYFDCRIILTDLPGIEYMKNLVLSGRARLLGREKRLLPMLKAPVRGARA